MDSLSDFVNFLSLFCQFFVNFLTIFVNFLSIFFVNFLSNFIKVLSNFRKIFTIFCIQYSIFSIFQNLQDSNLGFAKFCWKIFKILQNLAKSCKILQNLTKFRIWIFQKSLHFLRNLAFFVVANLLARRCSSCRSWKMLQNAYLDAKIGVDPAENEPRKEWWCRGQWAPNDAYVFSDESRAATRRAWSTSRSDPRP